VETVLYRKKCRQGRKKQPLVATLQTGREKETFVEAVAKMSLSRDSDNRK
jgi:hypothetical protein